MALTLKTTQSTISGGLNGFTYTVPAVGVYSLKVFCTFPAPCGVIITIAQNGTPIAATPTSLPGIAQIEINLKAVIPCEAGDVITVSLTDSIVNDPAIVSITTLCTLFQGT